MSTSTLSLLKQAVRRALPHPIYQRYRQHRVATIIARYTPREVTHMYGGHPLRIQLADPLSEGWYDHDWPELSSLRFLQDCDILQLGSIVFDLGAHQGVVALMLARAVGDHGCVVAVEADPHNARLATINRDLNDASHLTVLHAAAGASDGTAWFAAGLNGRIDEAGSSGNVLVPTVTIDGLAEQYGTPDLVFIDVEGYEGHVLEGACVTLGNRRTAFYVEVHEQLVDFSRTPSEIIARFAGFSCHVASSEVSALEPLGGNVPSGRFFLLAIPS